MGSTYNGFSSDGPTVLLPSSQNRPSFQFPSQSMQGFQAYDSGSWSMDAWYANPFKAPTRHSSSWTRSPSAKTIFTNPSRKRSRNESEINDCPNSTTSISPSTIPDATVYGEGMTLLNPRTGIAMSAVSAASSSSHNPSNGDGPSRKAQRLDTSASASEEVELAWIRNQLRETANAGRSRSTGHNASEGPQVDDMTRLLGISWQRVCRDDDMALAVSGWEKYINNHFHNYLRNPRIVLKNSSLDAFLVAALPVQDVCRPSSDAYSKYSSLPVSYGFDPASCFFLFKDDLTEAQLVGLTLDNCLRNLQSHPIQFDGTEILCATERSPERTISPEQMNFVVENGISIAPISKEDLCCAEKVDPSNDTGMSVGMDMEVDL